MSEVVLCFLLIIMGDRNPGCELGENKRNDYDFFILKYPSLLFYGRLLISTNTNTAVKI